MANGVYAADGSWNVTVVSGTDTNGMYAPDGSIRVVVRTIEYGIYHYSGAILVTVRTTPGSSIYTPDGSLYVSESPYVYGSQKVTVVDLEDVVVPTAPVLLWTSLSTDSTPEGTAVIDNTVGAGDDVQSQIQVAGGDWSSPVQDDTHVITAPEDAADLIDLAQSPLANGSYDWRVRVERLGVPSAWSNIETKTISTADDAIELEGLTDLIELEGSTDVIELEAA